MVCVIDCFFENKKETFMDARVCVVTYCTGSVEVLI